MKLLTKIFYGDIIFSMIIKENNTERGENLTTLYSGLSFVSSGGRKYLKTVAQSLITMQNQPDIPVSDIGGREIMQKRRMKPSRGLLYEQTFAYNRI